MPKADIGSNAEEFWFWVANPEKDLKWIYWCNYRELETSDLPVTYQPDWIIEAMGLRPITPQEAASIKVGRGTDAGTTLLTFAATRDRGGPYVARDGGLQQRPAHQEAQDLLREAEGPDRAVQSDDFKEYPTGTKGSSSRETCYLPQKLKLQWKREQLALDVALGEVKVNQFDHAMGADIFVEPQMPGYARLNLAEQSRGPGPIGGLGPDRRCRRPIPRTRSISAAPPRSRMTSRSTPRSAAGRRLPHPTAMTSRSRPSTISWAPDVSRPPNAAPLQSSSFPGPPGRDSTIEG